MAAEKTAKKDKAKDSVLSGKVTVEFEKKYIIYAVVFLLLIIFLINVKDVDFSFSKDISDAGDSYDMGRDGADAVPDRSQDISEPDSLPVPDLPVVIPEIVVVESKPKIPDLGRYPWRRKKKQDEAEHIPVIDMTLHKREIDEQLDNEVRYGDGIVSDASLGIPDKVVCENGMTSIIYSGNGDGTSNQKKVIKTNAGFTDFGKNYIPGEDISLRDTESVAALKDGLSALNLLDYSEKPNELGKELLEALGINSDVISHLKS